MTTIATDGKTMAGDGLGNIDGLVTSKARVKVFRLLDGRIFGGAGATEDVAAARNWLNLGGDRPTLTDFAGLTIDISGAITSYGCALVGFAMEAPAACGSGMGVALGAMDAGASPQRAVEIAANRDTWTGGTILCLSATIK